MVSEVSITTGEVLEGSIRYSERNERLCDEVMIVHVMTGGTEHKVLELYELCRPKALFLTAFPKRNSLPAALESLRGLPRGGLFLIKEEIDIQSIRNIARRTEKFVGSKTAMIGEPAPWLVEVPSRTALKNKLGIDLINIDISEFSEMVYRSEVGNSELNYLKAGASEVKVEDEDLLKALKVKKALERIIDKLNVKSLALNCFELIEQMGITPCVAVALLNSAGIPTACEGDLLSLVSMIAQYSTYGRIGGVFNVVDVDSDRVLFAHCTAPLTMLDEYSLVPHYETGSPVAIEGKVFEGRGLLALRLDRELRTSHAMVGESVKGPKRDTCKTQIWMKVRKSSGKIEGNHRVLIDSDDLKPLSVVLSAFGIEPPYLGQML